MQEGLKAQVREEGIDENKIAHNKDKSMGLSEIPQIGWKLACGKREGEGGRGLPTVWESQA